MPRRKGEVTARMNERDYPYIVELPLPSGGFRSQSDDMLAFHRQRGIEPRRGRGWHDDEQYYVRYCFAEPAHADAFCEQFGGKRLRHSRTRREHTTGRPTTASIFARVGPRPRFSYGTPESSASLIGIPTMIAKCMRLDQMIGPSSND